MFGAIYGYMGSNSTFITLQGTLTPEDPLKFRGDVFFVSNGGTTVKDVGSFTWLVTQAGAAPAATLTLSSNILDVTNLVLTRFSYAEIDEVDMLTGGDWNIVRRILGITFGDSYDITDTRVVVDGITAAGIVDNADTDKIGVVAYFPPSQGDSYAMILEFSGDTEVFYIFFATNADMYGRYWLLDEGESPTGDGSYFHGNADTPQLTGGGGGTGSMPSDTPQSLSNSKPNSKSLSGIRELELLEYKNSDEELGPMFSESLVQNMYEKMLGKYLSNKDHLK